MPSNVENDVLMFDEIGKKAHKQFVQDRLTDKTVSFHVPVKKQNLKNFCKSSQNFTSPRKARRNIEIAAERNILGQLVILALQHEVSLERVLRALSKSQNWPAVTMARPDILAMK